MPLYSILTYPCLLLYLMSVRSVSPAIRVLATITPAASSMGRRVLPQMST